MAVDSYESAQWLLKHAGPIIRYRILVDILKEDDVGLVSKALGKVQSNPEVKKWLNFAQKDLTFTGIHNGKPEAFENYMGKLVQLGLRAGLNELDMKTLAYRVWLSENFEAPPDAPHAVFVRSLLASYLAYAGYDTVVAVNQFLYERLDALYRFARKPKWDRIFANEEVITHLPRNPYENNHRLINPELEPERYFQLPWIQDIRGLLFHKPILESGPIRKRVECIVKMILTPEYQDLPPSYGVAWYGKKYYVLGWAVSLPGWKTLPKKKEFGRMLLSLEMLAPSEEAKKSSWFKRCMDYLESFRQDDGSYLFPRSWLPEKKTGYWVGGNYMGFDTRRDRKSIAYESTFWMLYLQSLSGERI